MKSYSKCCTFVLIFLMSYAICSCNKLIVKEGDLLKKHKNNVGNIVGEFYTPQQQILHSETAEASLKDESRQKRSQLDFSEYKEYIDDLEDNTLLCCGEVPKIDIQNMSPEDYLQMLTYVKCLIELKNGLSCRPQLRPRPGRSAAEGKLSNIFPSGSDLRLLESTFGHGIDIGNGAVSNMRQPKQFMSRLIKKSVPFKPRLGKRTQQAFLCD